MVKQYLEKYKNSLLEEKINCENEYKKLEQKLKESIEFRSLLEEKNDPNFEAFTPYEINSKNKEKIRELTLDEEQIHKKQESLKSRISDFEKQLEELSNVIAVTYENEKTLESLQNRVKENKEERLNILLIEENERTRIADYLKKSSIHNLKNMVHKIELCSGLIDLDSVRCKMEMNSLSNMIDDIVQGVEDEIAKLHPITINDFNFDESIKDELEKVRLSSDTQIDFNIIGEQYNIEPVIGIILLRIILEICNSSMKYHIDSISITLIYKSNCIEIQIIEKEKYAKDTISIIKDYVYLLSGTMSTDLKTDENVIQISIPRQVENVN